MTQRVDDQTRQCQVICFNGARCSRHVNWTIDASENRFGRRIDVCSNHYFLRGDVRFAELDGGNDPTWRYRPTAHNQRKYPVPRDLLEQSIAALIEQADHAELWRGIRDYRIDEPLAAAAALRAIIGPTPEPTAAERAEAVETLTAYVAKRYPHLVRQEGEGE